MRCSRARWTEGRVGVGSPKALAAEAKARDVPDCAWLAAGELPEAARACAGERRNPSIEGGSFATAVPAR